MSGGSLGSGSDAPTRGVQIARRAAIEASGWGSAERFHTRGGVHQAAGHKPRCAAPRLRRGLGGPHGAGFDVRRCPRLEPGDLAGRVFAANRLDGVDQIDRATLGVCDAWIARGAEIYADASRAEGRVMLRIVEPITSESLLPCSPSASKAGFHVVAISAIRRGPPAFSGPVPTRTLFKLASLPQCELTRTRSRLRVIQPALAVQPRRGA